MTHRLFVGLRPPPPVRAALRQEIYGVERARWQDDDQLHLTLRFIGEVDRHAANAIADALGGIAAPCFMLGVRGSGVFARKGRPHTLWAGLGAEPLLDRLQGKVERACQRAGQPPETRMFMPHVTLARLNAASGPVDGFLARTGALRIDGWPVSEFVLYESTLSQGGARYEAVAQYPLAPA